MGFSDRTLALVPDPFQYIDFYLTTLPFPNILPSLVKYLFITLLFRNVFPGRDWKTIAQVVDPEIHWGLDWGFGGPAFQELVGPVQ